MPPNGFNSVSIDDETAHLIDTIITKTDCESRPDAIRVAATKYLEGDHVE